MNQTKLNRIYRENYNKLVSLTYETVKDRGEAHDIVADAFVKLFSKKSLTSSRQAINKLLTQYTRQGIIRRNKEIKKIKSFFKYQFNGSVYPDPLSIETEVIGRIINSSNNLSPNYSSHQTLESREQIIKIKDEVNEEFIKHYTKHPHNLYDISPRQYEKFVAELLKDMGYDVWLNNPTRDGGRDIIALLKTPSNDSIVTIVECKKYSLENPVPIEIVERFMYTIREKDKANAGWIVTTSTFSREAQKCQHNYKWQLKLKDNIDLAAWCSNYGKWKRTSEGSGLWLPDNPLG